MPAIRRKRSRHRTPEFLGIFKERRLIGITSRRVLFGTDEVDAGRKLRVPHSQCLAPIQVGMIDYLVRNKKVELEVCKRFEHDSAPRKHLQAGGPNVVRLFCRPVDSDGNV
jgi:hypothetical protein